MNSQNQSIELDRNQKESLAKLMSSYMEEFGKYLQAAVEYSHKNAGRSSIEFWNNLFDWGYLFYDSKTKSLNFIEKDEIRKEDNWRYSIISDKKAKKENVPSDPYGEIDLIGYIKYFQHGFKRANKKNDNYVFCNDSSYVFNDFGIRTTRMQNGRSVPFNVLEGKYYGVLASIKETRNIYLGHKKRNSVDEITIEIANRLFDLIEAGLAPFERKEEELKRRGEPSWISKTPLKNTLAPILKLKDYYRAEIRKIGTAPVEIDEIASLLFLTEKANEEERNAVINGLDFFNISHDDRKAYALTIDEIRDRIRRAPSVEALLGAQPVLSDKALTLDENAKRKEVASKESAPIENPEGKGAYLAGVFTSIFASSTLTVNVQRCLPAMVDNAILLVDETVFLDSAGRTFLSVLLGELKKKKKRLLLDVSVISRIFKEYRNRKELLPFEYDKEDESFKEELNEIREKALEEARSAIKALREFKSRGCLEVVESLYMEKSPQENLCGVVQSNPKTPFIVLTNDEYLSQELSSSATKNAICLKPLLMGNLFIYPDSRNLLASCERAKEANVKKAAPVIMGKNISTGDVVHAVYPDKQIIEYVLGRKLGEGGEGAVYSVNSKELCVKIYAPSKRTADRKDKILSMSRGGFNSEFLCWPLAAAFDKDGKFAGYIMKEALGKPIAVELFKALGKQGAGLAARGYSRKTLAIIAKNVAEAFAKMHENGIVMGDINAQNILAVPTGDIRFVDCDSYQYEDYLCPVGTPIYTPPEIHVKMRAGEIKGYDFKRSPENEKYSLAVLLFQILMIGKSPFESRGGEGANDVIDFIINGDFPYKLKNDDGTKVEVKSGVKPPMGSYRVIWSHLPKKLKNMFGRSFDPKVKSRPTAAEYAEELKSYIYQIEQGFTTNELFPTEYKIVAFEDAVELIPFTCIECGNVFNVGDDMITERLEKNPVCPTCRDRNNNFRNRAKQLTCTKCGRSFTGTVLQWIENEEKGKPIYCPSCLRIEKQRRR